MNRTLMMAPVAALLLSACMVVPTDRGPGMVVAPPLPMIVELELEPFYYQQGFYYRYDSNRWWYSHSRSGPWADLPRNHYPKETRFKGRPDRGERDRDQDRDRRDRR